MAVAQAPAAALIRRALAQELPYAIGVAVKKKKKSTRSYCIAQETIFNICDKLQWKTYENECIYV